MKNPVPEIRSLSSDEAEYLSTFLDDVHATLDRRVKTYLTWTPDIRFGWKMKARSRFVGCYVRWGEDNSPGGTTLTVFFCSEGVRDFGEELANLDSSYWARYAGCRHFKVIESEEDARTAAKAVTKLFEITSFSRQMAAIS